MHLVEQYWSGVLKRLQAEVDHFNGLITHQPTKGQENELSFARILERLVPRSYGIGTGLVIDSTGRQSRQIDIIIYDQANEPSIMAQTNQTLFPIENVKACIEVKTTVDSKEIEDTGKKVTSLSGLTSLNGKRPITGLLGYSLAVTPRRAVQAIKSLHTEAQDSRPDIACVIEAALVAGVTRLLSDEKTNDDTYTYGLAGLHQRETPQAGRPASRMSNKFHSIGPDNRTGEYRDAGETYPTYVVERTSWVVEPSRALLLFCDALTTELLRRDERPTPATHNYITGTARELIALS